MAKGEVSSEERINEGEDEEDRMYGIGGVYGDEIMSVSFCG